MNEYLLFLFRLRFLAISRTLSITSFAVSIIWLNLMAASIATMTFMTIVTRSWHSVACLFLAVRTRDRHTVTHTMATRTHSSAARTNSMTAGTCYRAGHYMDNTWTLFLAAVAITSVTTSIASVRGFRCWYWNIDRLLDNSFMMMVVIDNFRL